MTDMTDTELLAELSKATPLDLLLEAMPDRDAASFVKALGTLERYEQDPVILKSELTELRTYGLNRSFDAAWQATVSSKFNFQELTEDEKTLYFDVNHPEVHTAAGRVKRVEKATKAAGALRDAMLATLAVIAPIAARAEALKAKVGKRAPAMTKSRQEMLDREAKAMTCQICGRGILAETGKIAHHGYTRPGDGYQTSSCAGAKELPFEVTRDFLATYIGWQKDRLVGLRVHLVNIEAEKTPLIWGYTDKTGCTRSWEQGISRQLTVTRETYAEKAAIVLAAKFKEPGREPLVATFDQIKAHSVAETQREIAGTIAYIEFQQARYDAWKGVTHRWVEDAWVAL